MMKLKFIFHKSAKVIGTAFLSAFIIILFGNYVMVHKNYEQADGQIVVIINQKIREQEWESITKRYEKSVRLEKHIGNYALLSVKNKSEFNTVLKKLKAEPDILTAQADSKICSFSASMDTYSDSQWYISNPGYYYNYIYQTKHKIRSAAGIDMDVAGAWKNMKEAGTAKREVVVAVIDTGVDTNHPDLSANIWINKGEIPGDNIDNDNNGYVDDVNGWDFYNGDASVCHYGPDGEAQYEDDDDHGTHVAGIIAAVADNQTGIAGVASNIDIKIMTLKINGGENGGGMISDAIEAVKYADMMGADICNLSWGTTVYMGGLEEVMRESKMLFVAAAGNSGTNNDESPVYPACFKLDNLISVTSIDANGQLNSYSNYGKYSVDIAAPGNDIFSTVVGNYSSLSGSSMAAPQVTGVASLLYAQSDHIYAANVKKMIIDQLKPMDNLTGCMKYAGIPDAYKTIMKAGSLNRDLYAPVMSLKTVYNIYGLKITAEAKDAGTSGLRAFKWLKGTKTAADFKHGVKGTLVENNEVKLDGPGVYTFFAADYAGNETILVYHAKEDKAAPKLAASFTVAGNNKYRTISIIAKDGQSGLKSVKYMPGIRKTKEFSGSGKEVKIGAKDGKGSFQVKSDGTYTIYAIDNRNNSIVKTVVVKTMKASKIRLLQTRKMIALGDEYILKTILTPTGSTDLIRYESSDPGIASVTKDGKITARAEGTVRITAKTSGGLMAVCIVTVTSDG